MHARLQPTPSRHVRTIAVGSFVLLLALTSAGEGRTSSSSKALHGSAPVGAYAATTSVAAATGAVTAAAGARPRYRYRTLRQLGVRARNASLTGKVVRVRLTNTRRVEVRLAVVRDRQRKLQAWDAVMLQPGTRTLTRRLNKTPTGRTLNLRVTARIGNVKARQIISLKIVSPPKPKPKPPAPPAPPPPAPPPPPGPVNGPPTAIALSSAAVAENLPAGTSVGTLSATDPNPADTLSFTLVAGAGSDDNAAFTIAGTTLRTDAVFDAEAKASYAVRVRVSDGKGGSFERALTITVTNANDAPLVTTSAGTTANTEGATTTVDGALTVSDQDDTDLEGAVVRVAAGFQVGDDLVFANTAAISGTFDSATGVLSLTGSAPKADYQSALRSIGYRHTGDDPGASKTIEFKVSDGSADSAAATKAIAVTAVNDAPVVGTSASSLAYAENAAALAVDPALTVADADSTQLTGARVRISANHVPAQDDLAFTDQLGITGSYVDATGILTLSGTASVADYRTALRSVTYVNTSEDPSTADRTVAFRVNDGALDSNEATRTIAVSAADDPPVAVNDLATVGEDSGANVVAVPVNDSDIDGGPKAVASVTQPANGTVVITGGGAGVTYAPNADYCNSPLGSADTFTYTLAPGGSTATVSMTVTCVNDAPAITTGGMLNYIENDPATAIDAGLGLSDVDSTSITGATVQISGNHASAEDVLAFANTATISGLYSPASGTLTLSGTDTVANYRAALRAVTYRDSSSNPSNATRTVTFIATDGLDASTPATRDIAVTPSDNAPDVDNSAGSLAYTENDPATAIDTAITITDADSANLTGATVQITGNYVQGEDLLAFTPAGGVSADPFDAVSGRLTLTGTASVAAYEAALEAVRYRNTSDNPSTAPRTVTYTARDAGGFGTADSHGVTIAAIDDPAVAVDDSATVAEDSGATAVSVLPSDTDVDAGPKSVVSTTQPANGTVVITGGGTGLTYAPNANSCNAPPGTSPDTFTYTLAPGGSTATVSVTVTCADDPPVAVNDSATVGEDSAANAVDVLANDSDVDGGPKSVASVVQPANGTVVITGGGTGVSYAPNADYCNTGASGSPDSFTYQLTPGGSTATVSMTVTCGADAPNVTTSGGSLSYAENDPATPIDAAVTVTDADSDIASATVAISSGFQSGQDVLALAGSHAPITALLNAAGDVLTLSGAASPAAYQAALRDVTYANTSQDPSTVARTVTFTVNDGTLTDADTRGISVAAADDPPAAVDDSATVGEDSGATGIAVLPNDTDVDGGPKSVASVTQPANGAVVITGGGTGVTYQPNANYCNTAGGGSPDTFTYTLTPGGSVADVSMTVTCVNDIPVADDETFNGAQSAVGNTAFVANDPSDGAPTLAGPKKTITGDILDGDVDVDGPGPLVVTAGTFATNNGGTVVLESDGDFTYTPPPGCANDSFAYTVSDQNPGTPGTDEGVVNLTITGCVWYVHNNAPGNAGTSTAPFDTLAQAQSASAAGHTIFVFDGDNTTTGYGAGIDLKDNQRLLGEAATLQIGADVLQTANAGARPTITDSNADVVALASGNTLRGVDLDPQGTGGGVAGGAGDVGGTIDDVRIIDTGTAGTQPSLELDTTAGTFDISALTVNNSAASATTSGSIGVRLNNAGTVNFVSAGTISITTAGAKGLEAAGPTTSLGTGSVFDFITVTGSGSGGVSMTNTTGTTTFSNLAPLTTTSGAPAAFLLSNAGSVTVPAAGGASVNATGGPAVDVTGTSGASLAFDTVASTNSATDGVNIAGLGSGTFSAGSGSLANAAGIGFDLDGGSGAVTFDGQIPDDVGQLVRVQNTTGGTKDFNGLISDGNDGDGEGIAVTNNGGATIRFNGPLTLSTGSKPAFTATGGGTIAVTDPAGPGSSILETTTGTALNIANTTISASNVTFERISANGASNAIVLDTTGASGGLTVTGSGGTCTAAAQFGCSGGVIQNASGPDNGGPLPTGTGIVLKDTRAVSLTRMHIHDHENYAIRGTNVVGFTMADSVINATDGTPTNGTSAATAHKDGSVRFEELTGTVNVTNTAISHGYFTNLMVDNTAGALNAMLDNVDSGTIDATGGDDAVQFEGIGSASMNVDYRNSAITTASGDLFQYIGDGTGGGNLDFTANTLSNNEPSINTGGGGVALVAGAKGAATMDVLNNTMRDSLTNALTIIKSRDNAAGTNNLVANIANNAIGIAGTPNSGSIQGDGMEITTFGDGNATFNVTNNDVRQYNSSAIQFVAGSGIVDSGQFNLNISGNSAGNPGTTPLITLLQGIRVDSGVAAGDTFATCVNFGPNAITGSSDAANKDFRLVASQNTTLRQPGYAGGPTDVAAFAAFAAARIGGGAQGTATANPAGTFSGSGTTCP